MFIVDQRIHHLKQALEDVSVLAHLDGYRQEHLLFVDNVLKELGERFLQFRLKNSSALRSAQEAVWRYKLARTENPSYLQLILSLNISLPLLRILYLNL